MPSLPEALEDECRTHLRPSALPSRQICASNAPASAVARFALTNPPNLCDVRRLNGALDRVGTVRGFGYLSRITNHPPSPASREPASSRPAQRSLPSAGARLPWAECPSWIDGRYTSLSDAEIL